MQSISIINKTTQSTSHNTPSEIKKSMRIIAGKAAGICYMADDYLSDGIQDELKAIKRAIGTAKSGHYSVFEHGHLSFLINTSKMMAMVLNSMGLYSTSEKSARYTAMKPNTELEAELYSKWKYKFAELITPYYEGKYDEKDIEKLAMENARYMLSVFTPTVLEYTLPYNRAVLMVYWLKNFALNINSLVWDNKENIYKKHCYFYEKLSTEATELANILAETIGVTDDDPVLVDHKNIGIDFIRTVGYITKLDFKYDNTVVLDTDKLYKESIRDDLYGDVYISNYQASFAEVAQAERHRTLHHYIDLPDKLEIYVPKIIRGSAYEIEWKNDFERLINENIIPQGTLLDVTESGRFEDFVLKCKERLCSRAQLEIMEVTREQVAKFAYNYDNLCNMNKALLDNMIRQTDDVNYKKHDTIIVESRCKFSGYICKEPCKIANDTINYYRNI